MSQREPNLIDVAMANVGLWEVSSALARLAQWCIALHKVGPDMTVEEYGAWWKISRAQAYKDLALIRKAFPGLDPSKVYEAWATEYRRRIAKSELERGGRKDQKAGRRMAGELASLSVAAVMS